MYHEWGHEKCGIKFRSGRSKKKNLGDLVIGGG